MRAAGRQFARAAVVNDLVGDEDLAEVADLDVAARDDTTVARVVEQLVHRDFELAALRTCGAVPGEQRKKAKRPKETASANLHRARILRDRIRHYVVV